MSAQLGVGVRVYIRWNPEFKGPVSCCTGTITDGPYPPGQVFIDPRNYKQYVLNEVTWGVHVDGVENTEHPESSAIKESDLSPIDGGEPESTTTSRYVKEFA